MKGKAQPKLLSGGNPQIPKGDGDGPVQAYIAAMPGWKRDAGRLLDDLVTNAPPKDREVEAAKARERSAKRFPQAS